MNSELSDEIKNYVKIHGCIKVGLIGFGHMGSTLFAQLNRLDGFCPSFVSTSRPFEARNYMVEKCGIDTNSIVDTEFSYVAEEQIGKGKIVITNDIFALQDIKQLDVIVDATGNPEIGAIVGWLSLDNGKHLATFNIEADSVIGSILSAKAQDKGVVYTGLSGDEPAAIMELFNFASFLKLQIVAAGKGKNNSLRHFCTPEMFKNGTTSPKSMCSFVDGTNTMMEMAAIANAIGFKPDVRGMHGPECEPGDLAKIFVPRSDGGILERERVVDYVTGTLAPGVFLVVKANDKEVENIFSYIYKREGQYLALVRPYHLLSLEAPISIAEAVIKHRTVIASKPDQRTAEVIAIAKKDLNPGQRIDGIGGYTVRGVVEDYDDANKHGLVPIGLLENAVVLRPIKKGQSIMLRDVDLPESSVARELWERQLLWLSSGYDDREVLAERVLRQPIDSWIDRRLGTSTHCQSQVL